MFDINTYLNRITSQHKIKPKYMTLLAARLQPFIDLAECLESFNEAFDLDRAVGKQLDVIGEYVGVNRLLNFQPQNATPVLPDTYYRMLIKAKISLNNWDGTVEGVGHILGGTFPQYEVTVVDNQDMTLNVQIAGLQSLFESELISHGYITPKPMGVLIDYYVLFSIELSTELFIGGLAVEKIHCRDLPNHPPQEDNAKPPGDLYIAGWASENRVGSVVINKPPPPRIDIDGTKLFAAARKSVDLIGKGIEGKPPPDSVTVEPTEVYAMGIKLGNYIGTAAHEKPPPVDISPSLIDDYTHLGMLTDRLVTTSIAEKPNVSAFSTLRVTYFESGIKATNMVRYALPSASI